MFSFLLCTLNRPKLVKKCLESLKQQEYKKFEIIVVDQSQNDETEAVCKCFSDQQLHYYKVNFRGLSKARNYGLQRAQGQYICLCDDDAIYSKEYLASAYKFLHSSSIDQCALCGHAVFCDSQEEVFDYSLLHDQQKLGVDDLLRMAFSPVLIISRNSLEAIGGFDEEFGVGAKYGAGEETDVLLLLRNNHIPSYYLENMDVQHGFNTQERIDLKKTYNYYIGTGALIKKHLIYLKERSLFKKFLRLTVGAAIKWIIGSSEQKRYYRERIRGFLKGFLAYKYEE